jgi:Asp-tRNA(Asn)/Glu-tRNA(Gln) amidotransferase A subunit family amidase
MTHDDLYFTSAVELAALVREKKISPFNLTGNPAASIPCGWTTDGLPMGVQIVGRRFADAVVLQASVAFEEAHPWQKRPLLD